LESSRFDEITRPVAPMILSSPDLKSMSSAVRTISCAVRRQGTRINEEKLEPALVDIKNLDWKRIKLLI